MSNIAIIGLSKHPLSTFETFLLREDNKLVNRFLNFVEIPDILCLGQLNTDLRARMNTYRSVTWDFLDFIRLYVSNPKPLLDWMDEKNAVIYGKSVLRFFLRCADASCDLDIGVNLRRYSDVTRFLIEEGYSCPGLYPDLALPAAAERIGGLVRKSHSKSNWSWSNNADKSSQLYDLRGYLFKFSKGYTRTKRRVNVYLLRCEPYRHVLASPLSSFACYMTADRAVALFANSTFVHQKAFVMEGQQDCRVAVPGKAVAIRGRQTDFQLDIVHGPPYQYATYACVEGGTRFVGDAQCWILERTQRDPTKARSPVRGPAFEVVDWQMIHDEVGTYMRAGEPFILTSKYFFQLKLESELMDHDL